MGPTNNLHINTDKTTTTLFTPDLADYGTTWLLKLNSQTYESTPKLLELLLTTNFTTHK